MMFVLIFTFLGLFATTIDADCNIPTILQGTWFLMENDENIFMEVNSTTATKLGNCINIKEENSVNYTIVFKNEKCFTCVKLIVRTPNVLQKLQTPCINVPEGSTASSNFVCNNLESDTELITLFSENDVPVNCKSSIEGSWRVSYRNTLEFKGVCDHPDSRIRACQREHPKNLNDNKRIVIEYKHCPEVANTRNGVGLYSCLGDWFVDKRHYFVIANVRESRRNKKFRCFVRHMDDETRIGSSITAECNTLKNIEDSPELFYIKSENLC